MSFLTRDQILKANDLPTTEVEVPEWGGKLIVRGLTAGFREKLIFEMTAARAAGKPYTDQVARLAAECIVDSNGDRLFTEADVEKLSAKSPAAMDRVVAAINSLNLESPEAVEELAGN